MKVLVNTASTYKGGSVQVAQSFIEECRRFKDNEYHVILGDMLGKLVDLENYPDNFSFYKLGHRPATRVLSFKSHNDDLKAIESNTAPDVVFTTSGPAYWRPKAPHLVGYNLPHYIYRDSPFFSKIPFLKRIKWDLKGALIKYYFKIEADAYIVQTDDVNNRLKEMLGVEKVYTVSNTFSQYYRDPIEVENKLPERSSNEFRLLTLSAWYPHKNLEIIPEVIEEMPEMLKKEVLFVLTLPEEDFKKIFSDGHKNIINIGPVKPEEGPSLYRECNAMFLPTLLECFSASYAEAMAMEKPIITSDLGFAHSVCGDAALYANPMDPSDISDKIKMLIKNPSLQEKLIDNGRKRKNKFLNARERAQKYLEICQNLISNGKN